MRSKDLPDSGKVAQPPEAHLALNILTPGSTRQSQATCLTIKLAVQWSRLVYPSHCPHFLTSRHLFAWQLTLAVFISGGIPSLLNHPLIRCFNQALHLLPWNEHCTVHTRLELVLITKCMNMLIFLRFQSYSIQYVVIFTSIVFFPCR